MTEPLLYAIVNPSDAYTMTASSDLVAAVATLLVGEGAYMLKPLNGAGIEDRQNLVPLLIFGGDEAFHEWCGKQGIADLGQWALDHAEEVASALESVLIGSQSERVKMEKVLACISDEKERAKARATYHDERRSSLNDIGRVAQSLAKRIRSRADKHKAAPEPRP
jgi:hypothetical protein